MSKRHKHDALWAEAKRRCRLSAEDVRKAREMGLNPRKLMGNMPSPSQQWKAPVHVWVRELYRKRQEKMAARAKRRAAEAAAATGTPADAPPDRAELKCSTLATPHSHSMQEPFEDLAAFDDSEFLDESSEPWHKPQSVEEEAEQTDRRMLRRQRGFRKAADYLARGLASLDVVQRVVLFGSVAAPLSREIPRFKRLRRARLATWHEVQDLDLAVWVTDCGSLKALQKAQGRALNEAFDDWEIGVAHHQVDIHLFAPNTDRYLGRLCLYGTCPKGKPECRVPGCGQSLFLQVIADYVFDAAALAKRRAVTLFDRAAGIGPPASEPNDVPF